MNTLIRWKYEFRKNGNCIDLNADISTGVCDQFIEIILGQQPNINLTLDDSGLLNNFFDSETREKFNIFMTGALLNMPIFATHSFNIVAGEVHDKLDSWDEKEHGMANDLLFFINNLYIKHFSIDFMKIVDREVHRGR